MPSHTLANRLRVCWYTSTIYRACWFTVLVLGFGLCVLTKSVRLPQVYFSISLLFSSAINCLERLVFEMSCCVIHQQSLSNTMLHVSSHCHSFTASRPIITHTVTVQTFDSRRWVQEFFRLRLLTFHLHANTSTSISCQSLH